MFLFQTLGPAPKRDGASGSSAEKDARREPPKAEQLKNMSCDSLNALLSDLNNNRIKGKDGFLLSEQEKQKLLQDIANEKYHSGKCEEPTNTKKKRSDESTNGEGCGSVGPRWAQALCWLGIASQTGSKK